MRNSSIQVSNRDIRQGISWAWFVYFAQIPFVIWYAQGGVPIHPIVIMLPLVGLLNFKFESRGKEELGLRWVYPGRSLLLAFSYAGLSFCGLLIASRIAGIPIKVRLYPSASVVAAELLFSLLVSVFIIALWEEVVNRGYIQTRLQAGWGFWGITVSAFLFASMHVPSTLTDYSGNLNRVMVRFIEAGLAGFVLGYVYWKTKSVLTCIAIHGLNNFLTTGVFPLVSGIDYQEVLFQQAHFHILWLVLQVGLTVILCKLFFCNQTLRAKVN